MGEGLKAEGTIGEGELPHFDTRGLASEASTEAPLNTLTRPLRRIVFYFYVFSFLSTKLFAVGLLILQTNYYRYNKFGFISRLFIGSLWI